MRPLTPRSGKPAATPDYGSSLLGRVSESQRRRRLRIQLILTVFVIVADLIGVGLAVLIVSIAIPVPSVFAADVRWILVVVIPLYVVVADLIGWAWITRRVTRLLRWALEERPPTPLDRRNTFAAPGHLALIELVLWGFGTALVTTLYGLVDTDYIPKMLLGIGFGGFWACASCYLFAEVALWPVAAQALEAGKPGGRTGTGIMVRTITAWLTGSGVPLIGIAITAVFGLTQRNMTVGQFGMAVLILAVAAFALGFILILIVAWMIATPIRVVRAGLQRVEEGDLDTHLVVFDGTEIGELQRGFNSMVEARHRASELAKQNRRVEQIFGRYVSEEVKAHLLASPEGHQGSERRTLTVLMADIRGFTRLSETLSPERVVQVLNGYLARAADVMLDRNGTINEILGDGLLVFFGAPVSDNDAAEHAVAAALELQLAMNELNATHRKQGLPELAIGIAVHTGEAVVGTIGSQRRQKYAAIGKNVNLAGRIESHTVGGQVLVSDSTYREISQIAHTLGSLQVRVKGLTDAVIVHDVRGLAGEYNLQLPTADRALTPLAVPSPIVMALIKDKVVGDRHPAEVIASGQEAVRIRTKAVVAPFDDLMLDVAGAEVFVKVVECDLQEGICDLFAVYTSVTDDVRRALVASAADNRG